MPLCSFNLPINMYKKYSYFKILRLQMKSNFSIVQELVWLQTRNQDTQTHKSVFKSWFEPAPILQKEYMYIYMYMYIYSFLCLSENKAQWKTCFRVLIWPHTRLK